MDLELNTITSSLKGNIGFDMKPMQDGSRITNVSTKERCGTLIGPLCAWRLRLWLQLEFLREMAQKEKKLV